MVEPVFCDVLCEKEEKELQHGEGRERRLFFFTCFVVNEIQDSLLRSFFLTPLLLLVWKCACVSVTKQAGGKSVSFFFFHYLLYCTEVMIGSFLSPQVCQSFYFALRLLSVDHVGACDVRFIYLFLSQQVADNLLFSFFFIRQ